MAVSMTKDVLFTAAFLGSFIKVMELKDNGFCDLRYRNWILIFVLFTLVSLLRNNGKYAIYALLVAFFIEALITKKYIKQTYVLAITTTVLIFVSNNVLMEVTQASPGSKNEMMSLPYQQLARAYKYEHDSFLFKDVDSIKKLIPDISQYNEHLSDPIKWSATVFNSVENQKLFWYIYFKYMQKNWNRYIEAVLINTIGYWYIDDISSSQMYGKRLDGGINDDFGLFLMDTRFGFGVTHESRFSWLDNVLKKLFHENNYQKLPIIAIIFNMGTYFWLLMMFVTYSIQIRKKSAIVPLTFLLVYMATVFAGPCALFRYALPYITCIPVLFTLYMQPECMNSPKNNAK